MQTWVFPCLSCKMSFKPSQFCDMAAENLAYPAEDQNSRLVVWSSCPKHGTLGFDPSAYFRWLILPLFRMSHFFVATALMTAFTQEPGGVEQAKGPARREGLEDWTKSVGSWSIKGFGQSFADRSLDMENGETMGHGIPLK